MDVKDISENIRAYSKAIKDVKKECYKPIKIAILASSTIKGMKESLFMRCLDEGVYAGIYIGSYSQYAQEILDKGSGFNRFKPDLAILFIDTMSMLGDLYLNPYGVSEAERKERILRKKEELLALCSRIKEACGCKIILHNFEVPSSSPLGILESKERYGIVEAVDHLNSMLRDSLKNDSQAFLFDYDAFCSRIGKDVLLDHNMYYLGDFKIGFGHMDKLCREYLAYIKPMLSLARKCIVLDLDNTLWGGIIGEDGIEGIKLGPTPEGRPFLEFQRYLLSLFQRGVILAVNSKNNYDDAIQVLKEHPYMVLREKHFAAMQINWNDKISNMKDIAGEINIGTDSMVFFDDDKINREMVRKALPEVKVVELPENPALYLRTIMDLDDFNTLQITEEDKEKGKMYAQQRKRKEFQAAAADITEYLNGLEMEVTIEKANNFNIPRISQLTQKTNQFNMTAIRYLEEDIRKFSSDDSYLVFSISVKDKFGDNGITGTAIIEKKEQGSVWEIDTFLLSCRVIGRKIEKIMMDYTIRQARKEGATHLIGLFSETKKNAPAKSFYKDNGFEMVKKEGVHEVWRYDVIKKYDAPGFIKIIVK